MRPLTTDLDDDEARPYFLWDETRTTAEFRRALASAAPPERWRLVGKLMREARDTDVWKFVSLAEVSVHFDAIRPHCAMPCSTLAAIAPTIATRPRVPKRRARLPTRR